MKPTKSHLANNQIDKKTDRVVQSFLLCIWQVRRGLDECAELQACIVPHEAGGKRQYVLRSIHDPNYAVGFVDKMESECMELQGM